MKKLFFPRILFIIFISEPYEYALLWFLQIGWMGECLEELELKLALRLTLTWGYAKEKIMSSIMATSLRWRTHYARSKNELIYFSNCSHRTRTINI